MGAKTAKFIKECEGAALACSPLGASLAQINKAITDNVKAGQALYAAHAKRVGELEKELGLGSGADNAKLEALLNGKDPVIAKIDKDSDAIGKNSTKLRAEKTKIIGELQKLFTPFKSKVAEFEKFIDTKEKSKNPFKSKKSLPDAKKFVAKMKELQKDMVEMSKM